MHSSLALLSLFLLVPSTWAAPYIDLPPTNPAYAAVLTLTERGSIGGYIDGSFQPEQLVNRAEFVKMLVSPFTEVVENRDCFLDVKRSQWFSQFVCRAKERGIVSGDGGTTSFAPDRPVNYAEALKMVHVYTSPIPQEFTEIWYEAYDVAAQKNGLSLDGVIPSDVLTRGQSALLIARFLLFEAQNSVGSMEINEFEERSVRQEEDRDADSAEVMDTQTAGLDIHTQDIKEEDVTYDPLPDTDIRSRFLLLGSVSHILGAADVFMEHEALDVTRMDVRFTGGTKSIGSVLLYDADRKYIGRATRASDVGLVQRYSLYLKAGELIIPQKEDYTFYARAQMKDVEQGGASGQQIDIHDMGVIGFGVWSNEEYTKYTTSSFQTFQTSRSIITSIERVTEEREILAEGPGKSLGVFRFEGKRGSQSPDLRFTDLTFQVESTGGVSLTGVSLTRVHASQEMSCTVTGSTVLCNSIPETIGSFKSGPADIELFSDITVPSGRQSASVRITLNDPGSVSSDGSVTWTDGDTRFSWVQLKKPVARGTLYEF